MAAARFGAGRRNAAPAHEKPNRPGNPGEVEAGEKREMHETTLDCEQAIRPPVSIATYAAIIGTLLIMVLSAITFAVTSGDTAARSTYDPSVSLIGFTDAD